MGVISVDCKGMEVVLLLTAKVSYDVVERIVIRLLCKIVAS